MSPLLIAGIAGEILAGLMASPFGRYKGIDPAGKTPIDLSDPADRADLVAMSISMAKDVITAAGCDP